MNEFDRLLVDSMVKLRHQALALCRKTDLADDMTQRTLEKALHYRDKFEMGTNMGAWLYTIMRNEFLSLKRKRKREVEDVDGIFTAHLTAVSNPDAAIDLKVVAKRMRLMPRHMRVAVVLVGREGRTYEEAAQLERVAAGTMKSRVSRGRRFLDTGEEAIIEAEVAAVTFTDDANDVAKVRALYRAGHAVSEMAAELDHLAPLEIMGILAVNRIRGRAA